MGFLKYTILTMSLPLWKQVHCNRLYSLLKKAVQTIHGLHCDFSFKGFWNNFTEVKSLLQSFAIYYFGSQA
jgi:hypothetical protein